MLPNTSTDVLTLTLICTAILVMLIGLGFVSHRICHYLEHRFHLLPAVPPWNPLRIGLRMGTMSILTELVILFTGFGTPGTAVVLLIGILLQWACFTRLDALRSTHGFTHVDSSRSL